MKQPEPTADTLIAWAQSLPTAETVHFDLKGTTGGVWGQAIAKNHEENPIGEPMPFFGCIQSLMGAKQRLQNAGYTVTDNTLALKNPASPPRGSGSVARG